MRAGAHLGLEREGALQILIGPRTFSATAPSVRFDGPTRSSTGNRSWELRVDGNGNDDRRPFFAPDIVAWSTGADWCAGRDPVFEAHWISPATDSYLAVVR